ncbi:MAG: aldo/keto reductase [Halobacteriales archaeon]|nr:aldo/keto reductase [Halobacteriales archaeon]
MSETLPSIGLGTSGNTDPDQCTTSVETALEIGYRHIDTAQMYDNEAAVGRGIANASVDREDIWLATKIHPTNLKPDTIRSTFKHSLDRLGVDSVDMLYVHWPTKAYEPTATLPVFDELHASGAVDHVCVSNFTPALLDEAREILDASIFANQVEMHPLLPQTELLEYADNHDLYIVAYSPLGRGEILDHPVLTDIAEEYGTSPAQVSLAWLLHHDRVVPIPKATGRAHLQENFDAQALSLDQAAIDRIDAIEDRERVIVPDENPWGI